jgi:hypothetical protein
VQHEALRNPPEIAKTKAIVEISNGEFHGVLSIKMFIRIITAIGMRNKTPETKNFLEYGGQKVPRTLPAKSPRPNKKESSKKLHSKLLKMVSFFLQRT